MNLENDGLSSNNNNGERQYYAYGSQWDGMNVETGSYDALNPQQQMPQPQMPQQPPAQSQMGMQGSPLDPVEALERDILDYEQQMSSMQYSPMTFNAAPVMQTNGTQTMNQMAQMNMMNQMNRMNSVDVMQMNGISPLMDINGSQQQQQQQQMQPQMQPQLQQQLQQQVPQVSQVPQVPGIQQQVPQVSQVSQAPQIQQQIQLTHSPSPIPVQSPLNKPLPQVAKRFERHRPQYKPRSSIPPDLSSRHYASQCIIAAQSSRMNPFSLNTSEYMYLSTKLPNIHVTTYLNIRNGILRLWLSNPLVAVTIVEAAGCCKDARYFRLAEFAFEHLTRNGYINQGCCIHYARLPNQLIPLPDLDIERKPRQTIVVIGAGIAGLACARQLENLLQRYADVILEEYEDVPRVIVLEGRKRIGGRVYSPRLSSEDVSVDLGGDAISGFGGGNVLGVVLRRQLGVPVVSIDSLGENNTIYDCASGDVIDPAVDYKAHELYLHILQRMREYEMGFGARGLNPNSAPGSRSLIKAGIDPLPDKKLEKVTVAQEEESRSRTSKDESSDVENESKDDDICDLLKSLGYTLHENVSKFDEMPTQDASLGKTIDRFIKYMSTLTDFTEKDRAALQWYLAKFEYQIGDSLDSASLSSWSHHRDMRFTGRHAWVRDGMASLARGLDSVPNKLDVRLKTIVTVVEYDEDSAQVTLENGERIHADRVVVTTPLGCLKQRNIQFIPDLPQWKQDSIDRLAVGCVNKVVLLFDEPFWDEDTPSVIRIANAYDRLRGDCFVFQNHNKRQVGMQKGLAVGLISGGAAIRMPHMSDTDIVNRAVEKLKRVFRNHPKVHTAKLLESVVTRWQLDKFARGSYSHVGTEGTSTDHDLLGRPVMHSLVFAGEATCRKFPGTVHGAYISGLRASKEIINSLIGRIEIPDKLLLDDEDLDAFLGNPQPHRQSQPQLHPQQQQQLQQQQLQQHQLQQHQQHQTVPIQSNQANQSNPTNQTNQSNPNDRPGDLKRSSSREALNPTEIAQLEEELKQVKQRRLELTNERLQRDMLHELGERPVRPDRNGTANPFLLFQKDYWEICRQEADEQKEKEKGAKHAHASRNEIRASLGKKWRSLSETERAPYVSRTHQFKQENEERHASYLRKLKWYESESANFRQRWLQDNPIASTQRERALEEQLATVAPKRRKNNIRD